MSRFTTYVVKECDAHELVCDEGSIGIELGADVLVSWGGAGYVSIRFPNSNLPGRIFRVARKPASGNGIAFDVISGQTSPIHFRVRRKYVARPVSSRSTRIAYRM